MNKEKLKEKLIAIISLVFILLFFGAMFILLPFTIVREEFISAEYDNVCKYNYGLDYIHMQDKYFGTYCIELIHENITMRNPEPFDWTYSEIVIMCGHPGIFDLTKWSHERCHGEFAYEVEDE